MSHLPIASIFCADHFLPLLLCLLGAALLGWLLKSFMGSSSAGSAKVAELEAALSAEQSKNTKLSADLKKKNSKQDNTYAVAAKSNDGEVESLKSKLKQSKNEAKTASDQIEKMQAELNAAISKAKTASILQSEVETSKVRIDGLSRALEASKQDAEKYKSDFENANSERSRLSTAMSTSDVGAMQKRIDKLESDLDTARVNVSNLQGELSRAKAAPRPIPVAVPIVAAAPVVSNSDDVIALQKEIANLQGANDRLKQADATNQLAINAAVNAANEKKNQEIIDLQTKLKFAEKTIAKLDEDKTKLAQAVGSANVRIKTAEPIVAAPKVEEAPAPVAAAPVEEVPAIEEIPAPIEAAPIVEEAPAVVEETSAASQAEEPIVAAVSAPEIEEAQREVVADDLTIVEGIGPKINELVTNAGITTFAQLADASAEQLKDILASGGDRFAMHDPATWPQQAALLRDGKMEEFKALTDALKGGRAVE